MDYVYDSGCILCVLESVQFVRYSGVATAGRGGGRQAAPLKISGEIWGNFRTVILTAGFPGKQFTPLNKSNFFRRSQFINF